jgi:hypothetical protein
VEPETHNSSIDLAAVALPPAPGPTEQDRENARVRREIAERQQAEYDACLALALGAFRPGWLPSHRHLLVAKEGEERSRRGGGSPRATATVHTVRNAAGEARHFTADADGTVVRHESYEDAFGAMLLEPHPARASQAGRREAGRRVSRGTRIVSMSQKLSPRRLPGVNARDEQLDGLLLAEARAPEGSFNLPQGPGAQALVADHAVP